MNAIIINNKRYPVSGRWGVSIRNRKTGVDWFQMVSEATAWSHGKGTHNRFDEYAVETDMGPALDLVKLAKSIGGDSSRYKNVSAYSLVRATTTKGTEVQLCQYDS